MNDQVSEVGVGSPQAATPPSPTRWGADMTVEHRPTGRRGAVLSVDFDEDVVLMNVDYPDANVVEGWRVENVFEVSS